jgi:hypothetical protein
MQAQGQHAQRQAKHSQIVFHFIPPKGIGKSAWFFRSGIGSVTPVRSVTRCAELTTPVFYSARIDVGAKTARVSHALTTPAMPASLTGTATELGNGNEECSECRSNWLAGGPKVRLSHREKAGD